MSLVNIHSSMHPFVHSPIQPSIIHVSVHPSIFACFHDFYLLSHLLEIPEQNTMSPEVGLSRCLARWYKIVRICYKNHAFLWQTAIQCYILCIKLLFSATFCASNAIQCYILCIKLLFSATFCASNAIQCYILCIKLVFSATFCASNWYSGP